MPQLDKRTISLREGSKVLVSWPVEIGDPSTSTPRGRFSVQNKVINPTYQSTKSGKINATVGPSCWLENILEICPTPA